MWFREHGPLGPWWFASGTGGRFNLDEPRGSLYLASSAEAAARERIGGPLAQAGVVPATLVEDRAVSAIALDASVEAADLTARDALRHGVVCHELCTMTPYDVPRAWAAAFDAAGFGGIVGTIRFSPPTERALTVFGGAGARDWEMPADAVALRAVLEGLDVRVIEPPSSRSLTFVDPPGL
ncbi:RES domain-containing protein [Serinibacter salmoneus]|nr:RES domain-containing protein [Serinibacter salmoneus]